MPTQSQSNLATYKCDKCKDSGFIDVVDSEGYTRKKRCECIEREIANNRLRFANIPENLRNVSLADIQPDKWQEVESRKKVMFTLKMVEAYLNNFDEMQKDGIGLYIYSKESGSGKTHIMACICNELLKNHQVKFATSGSILQEIRNTYSADSTDYTENQLLSALYNAEILVIDDFGQEKNSGWVNDKFYDIINNRYLNKKVTMFTSNEGLDTLVYDSRIVSRLRQMVSEVHYAEEDLRKQLGKANTEKLLSMIAW